MDSQPSRPTRRRGPGEWAEKAGESDETEGVVAIPGPRCPNLAQRLIDLQEEDRRRIAADLHDCIGQQLCALRFGLDSLAEGLEDRLGNRERQQFADLNALLGRTMDDTRRIAMGLRPPMLDDLGVTYAIDWFCKELAKVYCPVCIETALAVDEDSIPCRIKVPLFRIAQEACNNACKHSGAASIKVGLRGGRRFIRLIVQDDGVGFDVRKTLLTCRGYGLRGMQERVSQSGGALKILSRAGGGTLIAGQWPGAAGHTTHLNEIAS